MSFRSVAPECILRVASCDRSSTHFCLLFAAAAAASVFCSILPTLPPSPSKLSPIVCEERTTCDPFRLGSDPDRAFRLSLDNLSSAFLNTLVRRRLPQSIHPSAWRSRALLVDVVVSSGCSRAPCKGKVRQTADGGGREGGRERGAQCGLWTAF